MNEAIMSYLRESFLTNDKALNSDELEMHMKFLNNHMVTYDKEMIKHIIL